MLDALIVPRSRDIGDGFMVRRALPAAERRTLGPFVFFDQMGPVTFKATQGLAVRPHPHIGLATVTYLFQGEIMHRDSLGSVQAIRPGEVNWMTAGRGIVHSERTPPQPQATGSSVFGIQVWVALPEAHEEAEPAFVHLDSGSLPVQEEDGCRVRLVAGTLRGARSPVPTFSAMVYADAAFAARGRLAFAPEHPERAAYVAEGAIDFEGKAFGAGQLLVFQPGKEIVLAASAPGARVLLLGGEPLGRRYLWWNFVASRKERLEQAAADWKAGRFAPVPGETEFIPLPERGPGGDVHYP